MIGKFRLVASLLIFGSLVAMISGQKICRAGRRRREKQLFFLVEEILIELTKKHFIKIEPAPGGAAVEESLTYDSITELFDEHYGKGTSTADWMVGLVEIFGSSREGRTTPKEHLAAIVGLAQQGNYESAREETVLMIFSALYDSPDLGPGVDYHTLSKDQQGHAKDILRPLFNSIHTTLSDTEFEYYLNLAVGTTLALAMDTTATMEANINAARKQFHDIIEKTHRTVNQPLLYVLSPYNDPDTGPLTVTRNIDEIKEALNDLYPRGGGDVPEMAGTGIFDALLKSSKRSVLFHITDAPVKDHDLENRVIALAVIRKIRIVHLLTNQRITEKYGEAWYRRVARASGGFTTAFHRNDIDDATQIFNTLTAQGQVILAFNTFRTNSTFTVPLEKSLGDITITVATCYTWTYLDIIEMKLKEAGGPSQILTPETIFQSDGTQIFKISAGDISKFDSLELTFDGELEDGYSIEISADSVLGAVSEVKQLSGDSWVGVSQYKAGSKAIIETKLFGDPNNDNIITKIQLHAEDGSVLEDMVADECGREEFYYVTEAFDIPAVPFFVVVEGTDSQNRVFQRSDPHAIKPLVADISMSSMLDQKIIAGDKKTLTITVKNNEAASIDFNYDASDVEGFVTLASNKEGTISPSQEEILTIEIDVPVDTNHGTVSRVLVIAAPKSKDFLFINFNIIVENLVENDCEPYAGLNDGHVDCSNGNVHGSVCELTCNAGFAVDGPASTQCKEGVWTEQILKCKEVGFKTCTLHGDPHYTTFDGKYYEYMGVCIYTIAKNTNTNLEDFRVEVENERRPGWAADTVSYVKQAFIYVYDLQINLRKGREVVVSNLKVNLPHHHARTGLSIELSGCYVVVKTKFGLEVRYDGDLNLYVILSGVYATHVQGLCGNMDGDPNNDLTIPGQATDTDIDNYATHFKVQRDEQDPRLECEQQNPVGRRRRRSLDSFKCGNNHDIYTEKCSIITENCFKSCHKHLDTTGPIKSCVFDMCLTGGSDITLRHSIEYYASQCQHLGIKICNYREDRPELVPVCPSHSHFEHEGTGCPNTCRKQNRAARCKLPKVSGCVCDEGFVLSGQMCVKPSQCGCFHNDLYFLNGQHYTDEKCTKSCTCNSGIMTCDDYSCGAGESCQNVNHQYSCYPESFATCNGNGDPHYVSFDGSMFAFRGVCSYQLVETDHTLDRMKRFQLVVENEYIEGKNAVSPIREARFTFYHERLKLHVVIAMNKDGGNKGQATVMGLFGTGRKIVTAYTDKVINIQTSNKGVIVEFGFVTVQWRNSFISVTLPSTYKNKVDGLCGTYNDNPGDDLTDFDGKLAKDGQSFGKSFLVGECNITSVEHNNDSACTAEEQQKWSSDEYCGVITSQSGPFSRCAAKMNLDLFYKDCMYDMCLSGDDASILSEVLTLVASQCTIHVECEWRQQIPAISDLYVCPENSIYSGCASACPATCFDPNAPYKCNLPVEEGCACKMGYVMHHGECIKEKQCGCFTQEYGYVQQGFSQSNEDCTRRGSCKDPGHFVFAEYKCNEDEKCTKIEDDYHCIPQHGYLKTCDVFSEPQSIGNEEKFSVITEKQDCYIFGFSYPSLFMKIKFRLLSFQNGDDKLEIFAKEKDDIKNGESPLYTLNERNKDEFKCKEVIVRDKVTFHTMGRGLITLALNIEPINFQYCRRVRSLYSLDGGSLNVLVNLHGSYSAPPIVEAWTIGNTNYHKDTFSTSVKVFKTTFVATIVRTDKHIGWGQEPQLCWNEQEKPKEEGVLSTPTDADGMATFSILISHQINKATDHQHQWIYAWDEDEMYLCLKKNSSNQIPYIPT